MLCLLSVLCVRISCLRAEEADAGKCAEYFVEILEIQKMREMLQYGVDALIERYERGEVSKKELDTSLTVWQNTEDELRQKVTKIYEIAHATKCFDSGASKEEK